MDAPGRPAPFPVGGAAAGPIVPPPQGILFGRAAAAAIAGAGNTARIGVNKKSSPSRPRKLAPPLHQAVHKQVSKASSSQGSDLQREEQAKARRLERFKGERRGDDRQELGLPKADTARQSRFEASRLPRPEPPLRRLQAKPIDNVPDEVVEMEVAETVADDCLDVEAIVGTCNDMCPESERQERERKGDLDRFERVDGDRNLTRIDLAVKKYTRTASREAALIRPLPVLQLSVDHLLTLIDREYGEGLLTIHNFLWDRMRAVRMDLRMQHIFNREAITMHEQMIRFHILAMHELCEFSKGEGLNEGFDAHLNIEQMNKASVDLFEMYDDHRKRGMPVSTEAEFRGYYALLKLDKHPGYVVEPAELSLDLAKMTPEMRNTAQVLFAREVARACRGGNYIAFFRLARKATYLQACLMHAHFSKLRTEALASLHSGLQKNQGVPLMLVVTWLAMEGEDIEAFVKYHGFSLKHFEKLYAVKEGPFLNRNADFRTRRSRLVEGKHSLKVVLDVEGQGQQQATADSWVSAPLTPIVHEEEMPDYEEEEMQSPVEPAVKNNWGNTPGSGMPGLPWRMQSNEEVQVSTAASAPLKGMQEVFSSGHSSTGNNPPWHTAHQGYLGVISPEKPRWMHDSFPGHISKEVPITEGDRKLVAKLGAEVEEEEDDLPEVSPTMEEVRAKRALEWEVEKETEREKERERERRRRQREEAEAAAALWAAKQAAAAEAKRLELEKQTLAFHKAEANAGKRRQWLRRWKRKALIRAEDKRRRRKRAEAALSSLSAGPPLSKDVVLRAGSEHTTTAFDQVVKERAKKLQEMWAPIDVASLVAPTLAERNVMSKMITFKLLLSVGDPKASNLAGQWLHAKLAGSHLLLPAGIEKGHAQGLWFLAKDLDINAERWENVSKTASEDISGYGVSGLVFLIQEGQPISEERVRLHAIVQSLPAGPGVPLLLFSTQQADQIGKEGKDLETSLGLQDLDGSKIRCWCVSPVTSNSQASLYSDDFLKQGLVWLASNSPLQPNLCSMHVRTLVLDKLNGHSKLLLASAPSKVTPERCVAVFNRALKSTADAMQRAVDSAPPHWPPPEVESDVYQLLHEGLPQLGWNESVNLDPMFTAIRLAELPPFPALEQLRQGSPTSSWENVRHQKGVVERALQQYLALLDGTRQDSAATIRQAQLMVQRACMLEWTESGRVLVPHWAVIFQAIYQARLLLLNSEPPPIVYVLIADEELEQQFELDEIEQGIPFCNEIVAGSLFGVPHQVKLMFEDMFEGQEVGTNAQHSNCKQVGLQDHAEKIISVGMKEKDITSGKEGVEVRNNMPSHSWSFSVDGLLEDSVPTSSRKQQKPSSFPGTPFLDHANHSLTTGHCKGLVSKVLHHGRAERNLTNCVKDLSCQSQLKK